MTVNEFLAKYSKPMPGCSDLMYIRPRVKCADGYTVSIQAGYGLYSTPRIFADFYTKVELGYPSAVDEDLLEYAESENAPLDTIYAFVPVALIEKVLERHGGIIGADMSNDGAGIWRGGESHD